MTTRTVPSLNALLLVTPAMFLGANSFGQDLLNTKTAQQACGPANVEYGKPELKNNHPPILSVPTGKALIYLIQIVAPHSSPCIGGCGPIVRLGIDGKWAGATFGNSYFSMMVDPGDRHICANWQARGKIRSQLVALQSLHAESGKTYYYGVQVLDAESQLYGTYGFGFVPLDSDEARMLLESDSLSDSKPKP